MKKPDTIDPNLKGKFTEEEPPAELVNNIMEIVSLEEQAQPAIDQPVLGTSFRFIFGGIVLALIFLFFSIPESGEPSQYHLPFLEVWDRMAVFFSPLFTWSALAVFALLVLERYVMNWGK